MTASGKYKLNGIDLFDNYGLVISTGTEAFLRFPKRKEPLSFDWSDRNGIEYDLSSPTFEGRTANLDGFISGNGETDFWFKYNALFSALSAPGEHVLEVTELGRSYKVFYRENPLHKRVTKKIKNSTVIWTQVQLVFEILDTTLISTDLYYFGPVSAFPTDWAGISGLPYSQASSQNVINLITGTTLQRFVVAIQTSKSIQTAYDLGASNSDVKSEYAIRSTGIVNPQGVAYKVYGSLQAIPFPIGRTHQITTD